jgi:predicted nucleotidyltransferase
MARGGRFLRRRQIDAFKRPFKRTRPAHAFPVFGCWRKDAPTQLSGSHLDIPALLAPYGEKGLTFVELSEKLEKTLRRKVVFATGGAGTVYLCHPFLVHAAQRHKGDRPGFMAQPPPLPSGSFGTGQKENHYSPVRLAIKRGLVIREDRF